ncbi:hypothetical protein ACHAXM_010959 [Skeletonema potamos]
MTEDPNSILREAQLINNDLGRHSVKCNFSTRLSGRFYQNCSLERHSMRRSRISEMQSKRRRLEKELMLEKRRVKLLGERRTEMENARESALDMIFAIQRGMLGFQALVRQRQAMKLLESMKHRVRMTKMIALFAQSRYRGRKGRLQAASIREYLRQQLMNKCATMIQTITRCRRQRKVYLNMLLERKILRERSAASIQALLRGQRMQRLYHQEMKRRQEAALNVQRAFRGMKGRRVAHRRREELARLRAEAEEKPKRIPLHMRRYSTYGVTANEIAQSQQRSKGPPRRNSMLTRRRGSIDLLKTSRSAFNLTNASIYTQVDADENDDSVATTITSLTNHTHKSSRTTVRGERRKKTSWQPPRRIQAAATSSSNSPSMTRRSTYSEGRIHFITRTPNREKRKSLRSDATGDTSKSNNETTLDSPSRALQSHPCNVIVAPISITDEACSIAEEVKELSSTSTKEEEPNQAQMTVPETASVFMNEVIAESIIAYNINSALFDHHNDVGESDEEDLAFLLEHKKHT